MTPKMLDILARTLMPPPIENEIHKQNMINATTRNGVFPKRKILTKPTKDVPKSV